MAGVIVSASLPDFLAVSMCWRDNRNPDFFHNVPEHMGGHITMAAGMKEEGEASARREHFLTLFMVSLDLRCSVYARNSKRAICSAASPFASPPSFGASPALETGLPVAKNRILIAIAKPACNARTTMSSTFDLFASIADTIGNRLRVKKTAEKARPTAVKA